MAAHGVGAASLRGLIERFGSAEEAWRAPERELVLALPPRALRALVAARPTIDPLRRSAPVDEIEACVLEILSLEPWHIDEVARASRLPSSAVSSALATMELKGMVRHMGGMTYVCAREAVVEFVA